MKSKLQKLQERSVKAISVFSKTVSDLKDLNKEIEKESDLIKKQIEILDADNVHLKNQKEENETLINNIERLLGL